MKSALILILLFTTLLTPGWGQDNRMDKPDKFAFGLKAGVNYSDVLPIEEDEFQSSPRSGVAAGLFFSIPINQVVGIQPELLVSQKGFHATGKVLENQYDLTRTTTYLAMPLLISFKPSRVLTLITGPQYSYLLRKRDVFENPASSVIAIEEFENEKFRTSMLSYIGGLDVTLSHFVLGARVGWNISANNDGTPSTTPHYRDIWYQATFGYRFYQ